MAICQIVENPQMSEELFDRVSVDFANRRMKVLPHPRSALPAPAQMARAVDSRPAG